METEFCNIVKSFDLFFVQETWTTNIHSVKPPIGYQIFRSDRIKNKRAKRGSGGVAVLFKNHLQKGLEKISSKCQDIIWVKLKRSEFKTSKDIYLACAYLSPNTSSANFKEDAFDTLKSEVMYFNAIGEVGIIGDLNSRISNIQEKYVLDMAFDN